MNCCHAQKERRPHRRRWRSMGGFTASGALLVLLPKCPMCIAAYLALRTGAGVAMPVATHLRPLLEIIFAASALLLLVRHMALRREVK